MLVLLTFLMFSFSVQAQKREMKNAKNTAKKVSDWRSAFPVLPNYRLKLESTHFEEGKIYFQTVKYQSPTDKADYFEIHFQRHPSISAERYAIENDWIKHLTIGKYRAYQIFPGCGLDFYKYSLEIYPDEITVITLRAHDLSKTDVIKIAENLDFNQILAVMKKQKNIY